MPDPVTIVGALQIDVAAFTETNVHWNQECRDKMTMTQQLYTHIGTSKIICASNVITKIADGHYNQNVCHIHINFYI